MSARIAYTWGLCAGLKAPLVLAEFCLNPLRYPSEVFVGDTFTYFAGMVFAVAGIMGHFSETLLLFFLPQIINFVYSIPQLLKIVPCPRHRLPKYDTETCAKRTAGPPGIRAFLGPSNSCLLVDRADMVSTPFVVPFLLARGLLHATPNMNLVNLALRVLGPQTERVLCIKLLTFQAVCCAACFGARWMLAGWWKA